MYGQFSERGMDPRANGKKSYHGCHVEFQSIEEIDKAATDLAGRPIYKSKEILLVKVPGGDATPVEVTEQHRREYAEQYAAFKSGQEQPLEGTPLTQWAAIPRTVALELAHFGIKTVEHLAEATGEAKKKLGPLGSWCKKAKDWLDAANSTQAQVASMKEQIEKRDAKIQKLEDQITQLIQRIEATEGTRLRA